MDRKKFLEIAGPAFLLLANGQLVRANGFLGAARKKKKKIRFAIASDGHYGEKDTDYENFHKTLVTRINEEHQQENFDFCMINGDIVHNDPAFYRPAKAALDQLLPRYYVTYGNHDRVSAAEWERIWGMPFNYDFVMGDTAFLAGSTSDIKGKYQSPDLDWFREKFNQYRNRKNLFVFFHINQAGLTTHAINSPEFLQMANSMKNLRCIFNGHDHDEDGIKTWQRLHFVFDAHFGGSWGTAYRGFRVVELLKDNSVLTYILNPFEKINRAIL